jgi:hypothetical protein
MLPLDSLVTVADHDGVICQPVCIAHISDSFDFVMLDNRLAQEVPSNYWTMFILADYLLLISARYYKPEP